MNRRSISSASTSFSKARSADAGHGGVGDGAAQLLRGHLLVGHGLHHLRAGDEHVGAVLDHEDEVGHGRRVDRAAGAGTHDHGDLRHHAGGHHVALEHLGIAAQRGHALLDAGAARVVEADHRRAHLHGLVHDLADLLGMGLGQRAAEDGEVLAEDEHHPTVDGAVAGDHAVAGDLLVCHAEVGAAVLDEHVPLFETALVEQQFDALAGGQLAPGVLGVDPALTTPKGGSVTFLFQLFDNLLHT